MQCAVRSTSSCLSRAAAAQWHPAGLELLPTIAGTQQIRWRVRPRVSRLPLDRPNMNKRFYIPEVPLELLGSKDEDIRLRQKFETNQESLRLFLGALYMRVSTAVPDNRSRESLAASTQFLDDLYRQQHGVSRTTDSAQELEEQEHRQMMNYNDEENQRLGAIRDNRLQHELDEKVEEVVLQRLQKKEEEQTQREEALRVLAETEEFVKTFIEPENLMKELERAYDNPVDYCFAIDKQGYMYPGRNTKPWDIDPEDRPRLDDPNQPKIGPVKMVKGKKSERAAVGSQ